MVYGLRMSATRNVGVRVQNVAIMLELCCFYWLCYNYARIIIASLTGFSEETEYHLSFSPQQHKERAIYREKCCLDQAGSWEKRSFLLLRQLSKFATAHLVLVAVFLGTHFCKRAVSSSSVKKAVASSAVALAVLRTQR